ncbi:hypothetical protein N9250_01595 [bacterium]|nr:hypothetical protein [Rhodopirellula sp.]MDB4540359.1 hypothetical protein [bacterium]
MNPSRIYRTLLAITMIATIAIKADTAKAEINIPCLCTKCPSCDCSLEAKMVDVEKSCFEVETKTICIPRVVFPWQKKKASGSCDSCDGRGCNSCVNNGAEMRCIRVLKKKKYTCPECKYSWTPNTSGCCAGACDEGCAKADSSKRAKTKVVKNEVSLPPWLLKKATPLGPSELHTTELQPLRIQARTPWSSFSR